MSRKKGKAVFWIKGLVWLLVAMFVFTIVSHAAGSLTTAKVKVNTPSSRKIQYNVLAEGRIEKNREISVITQPDILIKNVLVSEGQRVKKGEVLAKLDMDNLNEQISSISDEKKMLVLQNNALEKNLRQAQDKRLQELDRARSDYEHITNKNKRAILLAKEELRQAREKLRKYREKDKGIATVQTLRTSIDEKQKAYNELVETANTEEKAAKRALEDAMRAPETDNSIDVNNISINTLEKKLRKFNTIKKQKGLILSPQDGVITSILVNVGQKTTDSGVFLMTDYSAGLKFVGQLSTEDAKYVSVGDTVTLHGTNGDKEVTVTAIERDEEEGVINASALVSTQNFSLGETVSMKALKESEKYKCTIPSTAVYQDNGKNFVLLVQTESTVLGEQEVARKMEVKVVEKNESYAALDDGAIDEKSRIITDSDRFVKAGDRVRILEE